MTDLRTNDIRRELVPDDELTTPHLGLDELIAWVDRELEAIDRETPMSVDVHEMAA